MTPIDKRDAFLLLDNLEDFCHDAGTQIAEVQFAFGLTEDEAQAVVSEWSATS